LGSIDAFIGAFPASAHGEAAEALRAEMAAWTSEQALESHEKAFAAAMAAMDWVEARQIADSARELADGAQGEFVDRWQAMSADLENQLAGVITARTAGRLVAVRSLSTEIRFVKGLALSGDGRLLVAGGDGGPITLWNTREWRTVGTHDTGAAVRSIDITRGGDLVCAGLADGRALLLRAPGCELVQEFSGHDGAVRSVHFSPDGRYVVSADADRLVVWDVAAKERVDLGSVAGSWPVGYSPDGTVLAGCVAGDVPGVQLWEMPDGVEIQTFDVGSRPVVQAFSPDGGLLATGHTEPGRRRLRVWDIDQGKRAMGVTVREGTEPLLTKHNWALAFSPDGALIVTGDVDRQMKLWDAATGQLVASYECTGNPRAIVFSPDCSGIVAGLNDGTVWVWEAGRPRSDAGS
jgi:WD40 repeat protein